MPSFRLEVRKLRHPPVATHAFRVAIAARKSDKGSMLDDGSAQLSPREVDRYRRQTMLDGWTDETQRRLKRSHVFVAGAGGLGSPSSLYLAVAGVGRITICDFDSPEMSNLNRQILHNPTRIGVNKAVSAQISLRTSNPDIDVVALDRKITEENVDELVGSADLILDCMDNFPTRYLLDESAQRKGIPLVHAAVWGMDGRLTVVRPPATPCLRCLVPEAPPREVFPIVGATAGVMGTLQALEALKCLTGVGQPLMNEMLLWEGASTRFRRVRLRRDPSCPTCARR